MILDKKFRGILDAGAGCLIVYDEDAPDDTYERALETLGNMSKVVDALYLKANQISAPPEEKKKDEAKDKENEKGKGKDDKSKEKKGDEKKAEKKK